MELIFLDFLLEISESGADDWLSEGQWDGVELLGFHHLWDFHIDGLLGVEDVEKLGLFLVQEWHLVLDHLFLLDFLDHLLSLELVEQIHLVVLLSEHGEGVHLVEFVESVHTGNNGADELVGVEFLSVGGLWVHDGIVFVHHHWFVVVESLVQDGFISFWEEVDFLSEDLVQVHLLEESILNEFGLNDGVEFLLDWEVQSLDWHNLLINKLDISDGNLLQTSDGVNDFAEGLLDDLSSWESSDISHGLGDFTIDLSVFQLAVDFVQKEFVVDNIVVSVHGWVFESLESLGHWDGEFLVESIFVVLLVDQLLNNRFVLLVELVGVVLVDDSIDITTLTDGLGDNLDLWNDVLVEVSWVTEVLLESWDGPELLEENGLNVSSEDDWVFFPELTEKWDVVVFTEKRGGNDFLKRQKSDLLTSPDWEFFLVGQEVLTQLLFQQKVFDQTTFSLEQRFLLVQLEQVEVLGSHGGNQKCYCDESLHVVVVD